MGIAEYHQQNYEDFWLGLDFYQYHRGRVGSETIGGGFRQNRGRAGLGIFAG